MDENLLKKKNKGFIRKIYDFVQESADKPGGIILLCILAFTEASFLPISPFIVLLAFCVVKPRRSLIYATYTLVFTVIGGIFGYYIGYVLFEFIGKPLLNFYGYWHYYEQLKVLLEKNEFLSLLIAGLIPVPFKVFSILTGSLSLNFLLFIIASAISRGIKYYLFSILIMIFGDRAKILVERNLTIVTIGFTVVLIFIALLVIYLF
jgi:membrane protein YqaA with SNARE-associated domain